MTMQKKKTTVRDVIVIGFALFSMFSARAMWCSRRTWGWEAGPEWLTASPSISSRISAWQLVGLFALLRWAAARLS